MTGKTAANAKTEVLEHERPERKAEMPAPDLSDLELAVIRIVQEDLPNVERPFAAQADVDRHRRADGASTRSGRSRSASSCAASRR